MNPIKWLKNKFSKKTVKDIYVAPRREERAPPPRPNPVPVNFTEQKDPNPAPSTPFGVVKTRRPRAQFSGGTGAVSGRVGRASPPVPKAIPARPDGAKSSARFSPRYRYDEDTGVFTPLTIAAASFSDSSSYDGGCSSDSGSSSDGGSCGGSTD